MAACIWFWILIVSIAYQKVYSNNRLNFYKAPTKTRIMLSQMAKACLGNLLSECGTSEVTLGATRIFFYISVTSPNLTLTWESSEKYTLAMKIGKKNATIDVTISAETVFGARHAMETFTQLTITEKALSNNSCMISIISRANISDEPVYKHRGLLLDTARHFFSVSTIKRTLDAMAASKMNVFHWHITDAQSFPLESIRVPELSRFGAFDASKVYTKKDIQNIADYAQARGIRLVIEIDGPAHVYAGWKWDYTDVFGAKEIDHEVKVLKCNDAVGGVLNVANEYIYEVLRNLYKDIKEYLPKPILLHMGGDEVSSKCWNSDDIDNYMNLIGLTHSKTGFFELWAEFHNKTLHIWDEENNGKQQVMLWSSDLTNPKHIRKYLDSKRYVIEIWSNLYEAKDLLRMGYRLVLAPDTAWYLDHSEYTWLDMYLYKLPHDPNVLGGEATMWTEKVDEQLLDKYVWPRAAAVAERLWSDPDPTMPRTTVEARLERHRERLVARGLNNQILFELL